MASHIPLPVFAEQLINSMLISYRASAGLLRGIRQFVQARPNTAFYRKVVDLEFPQLSLSGGAFSRPPKRNQAPPSQTCRIVCSHDA